MIRASDDVLKWIYAQSLATGVIPAVALGLGVLALAFLLIRRSRRWWLFCAITGVLSAAAATALGWAVIYAWYWWPEDLPATVIICVGFALWGLVLGMATAVLGLRRLFRQASLRIFPGAATVDEIRDFCIVGVALWRLHFMSPASLVQKQSLFIQLQQGILRLCRKSHAERCA